MCMKAAKVQIRLHDVLKPLWNRHSNIVAIMIVVFIVIATIKNNDKTVHPW